MGVKMNSKASKFCIVIFLVGFICFVPKINVKAQQINLSIEASGTLENAQVLSLTGLGIDRSGSGPVLFSGFMENVTQEQLNNLYIRVVVRASQVGDIITFTSDSEYPFSLAPGRTVYVTNNDLANEQIPGIKESLKFTGGLTSEGERFINNLSGSTTLPPDIYTVEVTVFQETDARGTVDLAQAATEIGGNFKAGAGERDIVLKYPGDVLGSEVPISNQLPQFSWEGDNSSTYRLLVVRDNGIDSPVSLLRSAMDTRPTNEGGEFLEFENLDVTVQGTFFQFRTDGAQSLESGNTYYWRVINTVQSNKETEDIRSEIWTFTLTGTQDVTDAPPVSQEAIEVMTRFLGEEVFQQLREQGFRLNSIQLDGQEFTGAAATLKLEDILQKLRDEDLIVVDN